MKRKNLSSAAGFLLVMVSAQFCFAQKAFEKSNILINGAVALQREDAAPMVSLEYGIADQIGAGVRAQYSTTNNGYNIFDGGVYANYHFGQSPKFDPFAGLMLTKTFYTQNDRGISPSTQPVVLNAQAGARYLFTNRFGVYAQAILPLRSSSYFRGEIGLSLKL